jgi:hypothetical protein
MQITTIGLDLAKTRFKFMASMLKVRVVVQRMRRAKVLEFFAGLALPRRNGSLRHSPFLGPRTYRGGASGEDHAAVLRESIR